MGGIEYLLNILPTEVLFLSNLHFRESNLLIRMERKLGPVEGASFLNCEARFVLVSMSTVIIKNRKISGEYVHKAFEASRLACYAL